MGQLYVVVFQHMQFEEIVDVRNETTIIGRQQDCDLRLSDVHVSRKHAMLLEQGGEFLVRDLGSRNGTYLEGRRIVDDELINQGAELDIGPFHLTVWQSISQAVREKAMVDCSTANNAENSAESGEPVEATRRLTAAQARVYDLFLKGLIEKEVAARLGITINTVHDHAKAIYKTLAVCTRGELFVHWAGEHNRKDGPVDCRSTVERCSDSSHGMKRTVSESAKAISCDIINKKAK